MNKRTIELSLIDTQIERLQKRKQELINDNVDLWESIERSALLEKYQVGK